MPLFWFLAGVLSTLAVLTLMLPWLRPGSGPRSRPWQAAAAAVLVFAAALGLYRWLGRPELAVAPAPAPAAVDAPTDRDLQAANTTRAGSMSSAIAQLQARLAGGSGSDGDWELLAKSYEFLGLPREAGEARAHRLPPPPETEPALSPPADAPTTAAVRVVRGEVTLAAALRDQATRGAALFIVAKAPSSPGPPVAVIRRSVSTWPVAFTLDDSQSMMPGRTLSSAGKVIIEARISQSGQAMPGSGDLVGTSGEIDPAENRPLTIAIDHVIR